MMMIDRPRKRARASGGGRRFGVRRRKVHRGVFRARAAVAGGELKFFDTLKALTAVAGTGVILDDSVNHIVQGVTESERVGRKCTIRAVHFRGVITNPTWTALGDGKQAVRIIVYHDKQANGATAAIGDILEQTAENTSYNSFRNLANSGRFKILYDVRKDMRIPAVAQTAAGTFSSYINVWSWHFSRKVNIPIEFSGITGAIDEIRSNNIGVLAMGFDNSSPPSVQYTCRLRYSDQ